MTEYDYRDSVIAVMKRERDAAVTARDAERKERDQARVACSEALAEANQRAADLCAAVKELAALRTGMMDLLGGAK